VNKAKYNDEKTREQELQAIEQIARKALLAGKYNIDLDASTLVDNAALDKILAFQKAFLDRYLRANPDLLKGFDENGVKALRRELVDKIEMKEIEFLTEAQHAEIRGLYNEMHKTNAEVNMRFIKYIRNLEKELGITRPVSIGIEERHVDDPKHKNNPSTVLGSMTLAQTILEACKEAGIVGPSKMSLQTGTMHGVGGTVDFGIYKRHLKYAKQIGIAVFVQHGASTL
ncbi:MAG: hypothetical protein NTY76_01290, partial [Candidatus Omnitrophica bacterium]|nr:hypothetical protein [Candidatus Omnitrophota bacterium]